MNQNITIDDVAKLAGVSRATAGRVVGGYGSVSEKSREKVLAAVRELNYSPNIIAQGLRSHSTKTIAVILGSIKNNYCNALVYAVEKEALKKGYNVIICNTHEDVEKEIMHLRNMHNRQVDGIILMSALKADEEIPELYRELYESDFPLVFVDRKIRGMDRSVFQSNNEEASREAARYLLELGHRKIGVIATADYSTVRERIRGYREALKEYHIPVIKDTIVSVTLNDMEDTRYATARLLDTHPDITAIYVLNNSLCNGVLLELKKRNRRLGEDISLLVWDDEALNELFDITTVVQQIEKIGKTATQKLLEQIKNTKMSADESTEIFQAHIIFRKSCSRIKR